MIYSSAEKTTFMNDIQKKFTETFENAQINEDLSLHTTFRIGGTSDLFYRLKQNQDLPKLISFTKKHSIPYLIIGSGSNLFFDDEGYRGLIIKCETSNITQDGEDLTVDAGVQVLKLVKFSIEKGLQGLENWGGLPGTVGGAVRGNAGCHGLETKDILVSATIYDTEKEQIKDVDNNYFEFDYRHSKLKSNKDILISARFKLKNLEITPEEQQTLVDHARTFRLTKQPFGFTTGSFFKNPAPDKPAGMLIDQAGLKGHAVGDAFVSEVHANFLMNKGKSSSKDMHTLISKIKKEVKTKHGIDLIEEVQIINPNGSNLS